MKTLKLNKATMAKLASNDMKNIFGGVRDAAGRGITCTSGCDSINTRFTKVESCCCDDSPRTRSLE
jgi:natural product precursor